jgi:hypothetical protein
VNAPITVTWSNLPGNAQDWVAITTAHSAPDAGFMNYAFVGGQANGALQFSGLPAGSYEARAYLDNTFEIIATSTFSVSTNGGNGTTPTIATNRAIYGSGSTVTLTYNNLPGSAQDWIAIATAGSAPDAGFVQFEYTGGATSGTQTFSGLAPGDYEARAYENNTYTLLISSTFSVSAATITTDHPTYQPNETVTVSFSGLPGNAADWTAIVPAGSPADSGFVQYQFTGGATSGTVSIAGLAAGDYEARAYFNSTYTILSSTAFTISGAVVSTDRPSYTVDQPVTLDYSGMSTNAKDWIAVVTAGSADDAGFVTWFYTEGAQTGSQTLSLPAGSYELRAYLNNTYTVAARAAFTVTVQ